MEYVWGGIYLSLLAVICVQRWRIENLMSWRIEASNMMRRQFGEEMRLRMQVDKLEEQLAGVKKPCGCGRGSVCNCD